VQNGTELSPIEKILFNPGFHAAMAIVTLIGAVVVLAGASIALSFVQTKPMYDKWDNYGHKVPAHAPAKAEH
jgi:hypothetical protein